MIAELREEMQKLSSYVEAKQRMEALGALEEGGKGTQVKARRVSSFLALYFVRGVRAGCGVSRKRVFAFVDFFFACHSSYSRDCAQHDCT